MTTTTTNMIDRKAPAPARATNSITLTAGSMVFPLSIYTAVSDLSIQRSERLGGDPSISVGRVHIRKDTGETINPADVTRMAEAATGDGAGKWVVITDAELAEVYGESGEAEVVSFVPDADIGRYVTDGLLQIRARNDKRASAQAANQTAFSLLLAGLRDRNVHALVRFVVRGGPCHGLLDGNGDMFTIIPAEAVRVARELPVIDHDSKSIKLMGQFIDSIGVTSEAIVDDTPAKVQDFIDAKAATFGIAVGDTPTAGAKSPVMVDVMADLQASITAAKATRSAPAKKRAATKKAATKKVAAKRAATKKVAAKVSK